MNGLPFSAAATTHRVLSRIFKWLAYQASPNRTTYSYTREEDS